MAPPATISAFALCAAGFVLSGCASLARLEPVAVLKQEPKISYHTHPPGRPPPQAAYLALFELGFCATRFGPTVLMEVNYPRFGYQAAGGVVTAVRATLTAEIQIWSTEGEEANVLPHEETHRAISEHYYQASAAVAQEIGRRFIGRKVALQGANIQDAVANALRPLQEEFLESYQREVMERCDFAQVRFDEITDNGRLEIANEIAQQRAIADEEANWAKQAVGR